MRQVQLPSKGREPHATIVYAEDVLTTIKGTRSQAERGKAWDGFKLVGWDWLNARGVPKPAPMPESGLGRRQAGRKSAQAADVAVRASLYGAVDLAFGKACTECIAPTPAGSGRASAKSTVCLY